MDARAKVILLEFNELTPRLIDSFTEQGSLPNFRRFREESAVFTTVATEVPPNLEPWIQWVTVHTGLDFAEHGVFRLNEGHTLKADRIWDVLSGAGVANVVFGSMNVNYKPGFRGCLVPDPWCTEVKATPDALTGYFDFVSKNVLEYSNDRMPLSKSDYLAFAAFLGRKGLSAGTVATVARQLASELSGHNRWKRAAILDRLQLDVFRWYFRNTGARFATFFLNSTAHFQHCYWRNMEPEVFAVKPDADAQREYAEAIRFGYTQMDGLLGEFFELAGSDTTLILCTALSQQPCLKYEESGGAYFHRPRDVGELASFAGIPVPVTVAPVMTHQYHLDFATEADAVQAENGLSALRTPQGRALQVERTGTRVFTGCQIYRPVDAATPLVAANGAARPFFSLFYQLESMKSGMHHGDGVLWIRTPGRAHSVMPEKVPLAAVAPTILELFDLRPPANMKAAPLSVAVPA